MAWEKHGERSYYYRSVRRYGRVQKEYFGAGPAASIAANLDALGRAERAAAVVDQRAADERLAAARAASAELSRACSILVAATLLAAGYHRSSRHRWRPWKHGRRILNPTR